MRRKLSSMRPIIGVKKIIATLLIAVAGIVSCSPARTTNTPSPTIPLVPTNTPTKTFSPQPTKTSTLVPTKTHQETTSIPISENTPTPIFTPSAGPTYFQLKPWNEEDALSLVDLAEQFSFSDNVPWFGDTRPNYQSDQAAIALAAQEALLRFPNTSYSEKLQWRIALANTIMDKSTSDIWMMQEIEKGLNERGFTPDTLDQLLNPFGFEVGEQHSAFNLFGNNQPSQVLLITRLDRDDTGLYVALQKDSLGHYMLAKVYSTWSYDVGSDYSVRTEGHFEVEDHTGDAIPEVILYPGYHNGTFCGYDLVIFQWEGSRFVNASGDQFSFDQCNSFRSEWAYGQANEQGAEPIDTWRGVGFFSPVIRHDHYVWSGQVYELSESQLVAPDSLADRNASAWVIYAMHEEDYATVINKVMDVLSSESQIQALAADLGPNYPDYLRFQLGVAHEFLSESELARNTFKNMIENSSSPSSSMIEKAAQAYLDNYQTDIDSYRACQSVLEVMQNSLDQPLFAIRESYDFEQIEKAWGYKPGEEWDSLALCNLNSAFYTVVQRLKPDQFTNVPEELKKAGVRVRMSIAKDLTGSGQADWILLVDTPGDDAPVNLWILHKIPNGIAALPVVDWERKRFNLPTKSAASAGLNVQTILAPDNTTITFIRAGDYLYSLRLDENKLLLDDLLWPVSNVESSVFYQEDKGLMLDVSVNTENCPHCKTTYQWSNGKFDFSDLVDSGPSAAEQAETALLEQGNPTEAIPLLLSILSSPDPRDASNIMYMLGLAYELTGDQNQAVQAYWKLWQNYPGSSYARLAQAKLELRR
jgi:tetratricopeptide (TPR) repeat protein